MRVTFRAQFSGRKGLLDTGGFKFPNPPVETIEVFRKGDKWFAREAARQALLANLWDAPNHGSMKDTVAENFETQLSKWLMFDSDGKPLDPARVIEDQAGNFTLKVETHVAAPDQIGQPGNSFKAACGIVVNASRLVSKRGQNPPDCAACKVEWAKTKTTERIA
jgi:hypothetical protein